MLKYWVIISLAKLEKEEISCLSMESQEFIFKLLLLDF